MNASKTDIRITSPDREVLSYSGVPKEHPFVKESPELFWYAVRVTYSRELALKEYLDGECIENFIPMHYEYIVKNERRVRKLVPAVHNLVFIRSSRERIDRIKDEMGMTLPIRYIMDRESRQHCCPHFADAQLHGGCRQLRPATGLSRTLSRSFP